MLLNVHLDTPEARTCQRHLERQNDLPEEGPEPVLRGTHDVCPKKNSYTSTRPVLGSLGPRMSD